MAVSDACSGNTRVLRNDFDADSGYTGSVELVFPPSEGSRDGAISLPAADFLLVCESLIFGFNGNSVYVVQADLGASEGQGASLSGAQASGGPARPGLELIGVLSPLFTAASPMGSAARVSHACADDGVLYAVDGLGSRLVSVSIDSLAVLRQVQLPPFVAGLPQRLILLPAPSAQDLRPGMSHGRTLLVAASCGTVLRFAASTLAYLDTAFAPSTLHEASGCRSSCVVQAIPLALQGCQMLNCLSGKRFFMGKDVVAILGVEENELGVVYCQQSDLERQLPLPSQPGRRRR